MLVHFREKIDANSINQINADMVKKGGDKKEDKKEKNTKFRRNQGESKSRYINHICELRS